MTLLPALPDALVALWLAAAHQRAGPTHDRTRLLVGALGLAVVGDR